MDTRDSVVIRLWVVWLALLSCVCAGPCPLNYRLVSDDPGCRDCTCCYKPPSRTKTAQYRLSCDHKNLTGVPLLPSKVTYVNLENNPIENLDENSFPSLPHLQILKLGNAGRPYNKPSSPLKTIGTNAFNKLPKLKKLFMTLKLERVNPLFSSIKTLTTLRFRCAQQISRQDYKTMFRGLRIGIILTEDCDFPLDKYVFEYPPATVQVARPSSVRRINLPESNVTYTYDSGNGSMHECLNLTEVVADHLALYCMSEVMDVTPHSLDWADRTKAHVNIRLYAPKYHQLKLGKHAMGWLDIWSGPTFDQEQNFTNDLMTSLPTMTMERLTLRSLAAFPRYEVVGEAQLRKLIGTSVKKLKLTEYRIGRIENFNFNLTSFKCTQCLIYCRDCIKAPSLTEFRIDDTRSTFLVDLNQVLSDHPDMSKLCLRGFKVDVSSFDLQYHPTIEDLEIRSSLSVHISRYWKLNFTDLVNLQRLQIKHLNFPTLPARNVSFGNLKELKSLDLSYNTITVTGTLDEIFEGLTSLTHLSLKGNPFWRSRKRKTSMERLRQLLFPVAKTVQSLNLKANDIENIPANLFSGMANLQSLSLTNNQISVLDGNLFVNNLMLSELLVDQNLIETIDADTVKSLLMLKYLQRLMLKKNRLRCTCDNRKIRDWIRKDHDENLNVIKYDAACYGSHGFHSDGVKFTDYTMSWLACDDHTEILILTLVFGTMFSLIASIIAVYYYRYDIMFWWVVKRPHRVNRRSRIHPEKKYHAFLSYSAATEQELAERIFRELEENDDVQFNIAYDCRDFKPGITIADNIIHCIDQSEKVLFLISRRFLQREWTIFELNFAQMRCFDERRNLIILIFVEPFQSSQLPRRLRALARQVNCLFFHEQQDSRTEQNFWHRLRIALTQDSQIELARPDANTPRPSTSVSGIDFENDPFMPEVRSNRETTTPKPSTSDMDNDPFMPSVASGEVEPLLAYS